MRVLLAALFLLLLSAATAQAAPTCTATIGNVAYGAPNVLTGSAVDTTSTVSISCTSLTAGSYNICLSLGTGSGGVSGTSRLIVGPSAATMLYNLYSDAARTVRWGSRTNTSLGSVPIIPITGGSGTRTTSATLYARLAASQTTAQPGAYTSSFAGQATFVLAANAATNCAGATQAATFNSPSFTVSASPGANCQLTMTNLSFGSRGVIDAVIDSSTPLTVACTNTTPYAISLDGGLAGAAPAARRMTQGAQWITYGLYKDVARAQVWHDAGTAGSTVGGTGSGLGQALTVYGRVPTQTSPSPGSYADTVVATVTY